MREKTYASTVICEAVELEQSSWCCSGDNNQSALHELRQNQRGCYYYLLIHRAEDKLVQYALDPYPLMYHDIHHDWHVHACLADRCLFARKQRGWVLGLCRGGSDRIFQCTNGGCVCVKDRTFTHV